MNKIKCWRRSHSPALLQQGRGTCGLNRSQIQGQGDEAWKLKPTNPNFWHGFLRVSWLASPAEGSSEFCVFFYSILYPYGLVSVHLLKITQFPSYIINMILFLLSSETAHQLRQLMSIVELLATWAWGWVCSAYIRPLSSLLWPSLHSAMWPTTVEISQGAFLLCFHRIGSEMFIFGGLCKWCGKWIGSSVELL